MSHELGPILYIAFDAPPKKPLSPIYNLTVDFPPKKPLSPLYQEEANFTVVHELSDSVAAGETVVVNVIYNRSVADSAVATDVASAPNRINVSVSDTLTVGENLGRGLILTRSAADTLVIADVVRNVYNRSVADSLAIAEQLLRVWPYSIEELVTIIETVAATESSGTTDSQSVTEQLVANVIYGRSASDALVVTESVVVWVDECIAPYQPTPALSSSNTFMLAYPANTLDTTVVLRNPRFGNINRIVTGVVHHQLLSGDIAPVTNANWPKIETLIFTFEALTVQQKNDLLSFLELSAGLEIDIYDHENRQWRGVIISNINDVIEQRRVCSFDASFEFRGRLVI
jgi:hypothetical protein